jgi:hypothetical protein
MLGLAGKCPRCGAAHVIDAAVAKPLAEGGSAVPAAGDLPEPVASGEDDRPWERPGAVRRDCEPHRGALLRVLKSACGFSILGGFLCAPVALVALGVGLTTWRLARRDLRAMRAGRMDPAGMPLAVEARRTGCAAVLFPILWLPVVALVAWLVVRETPTPGPAPPPPSGPMEVPAAGMPD